MVGVGAVVLVDGDVTGVGDCVTVGAVAGEDDRATVGAVGFVSLPVDGAGSTAVSVLVSSTVGRTWSLL